MPIQVVMDRNGDSRYFFEATDMASLADAQARFNDLTKRGFRAVARGKDGQAGRVLPNFDNEAEETLFIPPLVGG